MTAHDPAASAPAGAPNAAPAHPLAGAAGGALGPEPRDLTVDDFDFELPESLIAQHPASERSGSRLLDATRETAADRLFRDLPALLAPGDLLVFNDTRVIKARLHGHKASGGAVEALVERVLPGPGHEVWAHLRASKAPRPGSLLRFSRDARGPSGPGALKASAPEPQQAGEAFEAEVLGRAGPDGSLYHLRLPADPLALLDQHGHVPLPPYIHHDDGEDDERRYQSVFAARPGAVAAPTASLHFDEAVLQALAARGVRRAAVTLHVGAGTFLPMRVQQIAEHRMHSEWFEVGEATVRAIEQTRQAGGRIVAVGTTTVRSLESAAAQGVLRAMRGETTLFITPGYPFRVVDLMITNFHLPRSTLLMLVSAFAGRERVLALYRHAVRERYRFFSYGDAMLLARAGLGAGRSA